MAGDEYTVTVTGGTEAALAKAENVGKSSLEAVAPSGETLTIEDGATYETDNAEDAAWIAEAAQKAVGAGNVTVSTEHEDEELMTPAVTPYEAGLAAEKEAAKGGKSASKASASTKSKTES